MLRNLATRAMIPAALTVTGFVVVGCLLLYASIHRELEANTIRHETALAETVVRSTRHAMLRADDTALRQVIRDIGELPQVTHVRIFNKGGWIKFSHDPQEEEHLLDKQAAGCAECHRQEPPVTSLGPMEQARRFQNQDGRAVLAITAPIYNEPSCVSAACHARIDQQRLLGTLDIGLAADPLNRTLVNLRWRLLVFCLMVLALSVGGVSALLYRNVLLPMRLLVAYAQSVQRGDGRTAPPRGAREIEQVAGILRQMREAQAGSPPLADRTAARDESHGTSAQRKTPA